MHLLLRDCNGCTPLHMSAMCGHVGVFGSLLQTGGNSFSIDRYGYTPLHWACYNGHDSCVELIVEAIIENNKNLILNFIVLGR